MNISIKSCSIFLRITLYEHEACCCSEFKNKKSKTIQLLQQKIIRNKRKRINFKLKKKLFAPNIQSSYILVIFQHNCNYYEIEESYCACSWEKFWRSIKLAFFIQFYDVAKAFA